MSKPSSSGKGLPIHSIRAVSLAVLLLTVVLVQPGCTGRSTPKDYLQETQEDRDARMAWWREARFGLFIHWGLYAVPAGSYQGQQGGGTGEWLQSWANIPRADYEKFAPEFNPTRYDAAQWVSLAKEAGMKYIVITSKHHDGFALWDSKVSEYDIVDATPYGRDILADLARECQRQGIKLCFYHSIMDWHHPSQYIDVEGKDSTAGNGQNKIFAEHRDEFVTYLNAQVEELITRYDPWVLWFDGEWTDWWTEADGKALYNHVRSLRPSIIVNNRVGKGRMGMQGLNKGPGYAGDFGTPEQEIPATGLPGVDWETCMTMNDTWGFKSYDHNWKSSKTLVHQLIDAASKGGNYLLNVGPTADGVIPQPSVDRLKEMGRWMAVNSESIYGTQASPFEQPRWGRFTTKPGRLYAHVFDWPQDGRLQLPPMDGKVTHAHLLADAEQTGLQVEQSAQGIDLSLPASAPDIMASVVVVEFEER